MCRYLAIFALCLAGFMLAGCPAIEPGDGHDHDHDADGDLVIGDIETIAGTGTAGFNGDGGAAAAAMLSSPMDVAVSEEDAILVADFGNGRVRRVENSSGEISTVAGGQQNGLDDILDRPAAIAIAPNGAFYVVAWGDGRLVLYEGNGFRQVVAGTGESACAADDAGDAADAAIRLPRALALFTDGSAFFAEQGCHRIRLIDAAGELTTFAGTGAAGYAGDEGPAIEAQFAALLNPETPNFGIALSPEDPPDELFVADTANNVIREIDLRTGLVETFAGTGEAGFADGPPSQATFNRPTHVFASHDHAVWVVDSGNHAIRRIDPLGTEVRTVAGTGTAGFSGDGGPADHARLDNPGAVFVTQEGEVYVADTGNHRVRRFTFGAAH